VPPASPRGLADALPRRRAARATLSPPLSPVSVSGTMPKSPFLFFGLIMLAHG
jgi:hypothetical protein